MDTHGDRPGHEDDGRITRADRGAEARATFGGMSWGACFFGWLVAIGLAVLLTSIIGAILSAVGSNVNLTQDDAESEAGTIGIATAVVLLVVLAIGHYAGGYVAGRMSRFDGARQGVGVWLIGLIVTLIAIGLGVLFGSQYNILDRVNLPSLPVSGDAIGWGAAITALAILIVTFVAALLGGKVGQRYHRRVDRAVGY
ncbi:hypothetical protein D9V41_11525 [Aeromicrobium phragmitis]|uniref:Uncharacterized protein n=1 Tax=Aeromicrobium phragmitis TaxID=2478914 RepID=A0A3L8PLA6_9ACTN|nr:hypothetical protein [Aeromicrobium phragmitis]RLV55378.1 hypothetical protein D9V41_11525 [Aeromicrobium phragmitis]